MRNHVAREGDVIGIVVRRLRVPRGVAVLLWPACWSVAGALQELTTVAAASAANAAPRRTRVDVMDPLYLIPPWGIKAC
jgi:hypothetical protein